MVGPTWKISSAMCRCPELIESRGMSWRWDLRMTGFFAGLKSRPQFGICATCLVTIGVPYSQRVHG
jgi:hypothetical protein